MFWARLRPRVTVAWVWRGLKWAYYSYGSTTFVLRDHIFINQSRLSKNSLWILTDQQNNSQKAQKCLTSLKNFMAPLEVVMESLKRPHFNCKSSGNTLNKTVHGLHQLLETAIKDIYIYVSLVKVILVYFL